MEIICESESLAKLLIDLRDREQVIRAYVR